MTSLELTQLRSSASQHHAFCLRQHGTCRSSVCGFSARSAEKLHTIGKERTALPKAKSLGRKSELCLQSAKYKTQHYASQAFDYRATSIKYSTPVTPKPHHRLCSINESPSRFGGAVLPERVRGSIHGASAFRSQELFAWLRAGPRWHVGRARPYAGRRQARG